MEKISIRGIMNEFSNLVLHPISNYKELQDYRFSFDLMKKDYRVRIEKYIKKLEEEKKKNEDLKVFYLNIKDKLSKSENKLNYYIKENERLESILSELEKELKLNLRFKVIGVRRIIERINELKESDKK